MNNASPAARIKLLQDSMRCFVYGLFALLPVWGIPFAVAALWTSGRVRSQEKQLWNAAQPYRIAGAACAGLGLIFWFLVVALIVYRAGSGN